MAVTISGTPDEYSPVYNELMFVATSTQVAQTNFRFRVEILDSSSTTIATVDVFPDADNNMLFDAHRILESYVTSNPTLTTITELKPCNESWVKYKVKVTERYGATLANYASSTTSFLYAYNASFKWKDFSTYSQDDWCIKAGAVVPFLTNSPDTQTIYTNEKSFLHFAVRTDNLARRLRVRTYDINENLTQTALIVNNYYAFDPGRFVRCPAGWNLNDITSGDLASGTQPLIHSSIGSWKVDVTQSDGTTLLTETKTFNAAGECTPYTSYRLHFKNSLGAFDSFTLNRRSTKSNKIERRTFEPVYGSISGGAWSYSITEQRKKDFYIEDEETLKLNSDWITEDESTWLYELVTSPEIYVETGSELFSAHVKNGEYITRNHASDKIFNLEIELETSKNIRQRW